MADAYKQALPTIGLSVERGTISVPNDDQFHVVLNGKVIFSSKREALAIKKYIELRNELAPLMPDAEVDREEVLRRIRLDADLSELEREASRQKRAKALKKGGKGGSGGVGR